MHFITYSSLSRHSVSISAHHYPLLPSPSCDHHITGPAFSTWHATLGRDELVLTSIARPALAAQGTGSSAQAVGKATNVGHWNMAATYSRMCIHPGVGRWPHSSEMVACIWCPAGQATSMYIDWDAVGIAFFGCLCMIWTVYHESVWVSPGIDQYSSYIKVSVDMKHLQSSETTLGPGPGLHARRNRSAHGIRVVVHRIRVIR